VPPTFVDEHDPPGIGRSKPVRKRRTSWSPRGTSPVPAAEGRGACRGAACAALSGPQSRGLSESRCRRSAREAEGSKIHPTGRSSACRKLTEAMADHPSDPPRNRTLPFRRRLLRRVVGPGRLSVAISTSPRTNTSAAITILSHPLFGRRLGAEMRRSRVRFVVPAGHTAERSNHVAKAPEMALTDARDRATQISIAAARGAHRRERAVLQSHGSSGRSKRPADVVQSSRGSRGATRLSRRRSLGARLQGSPRNGWQHTPSIGCRIPDDPGKKADPRIS
jgi:hypothetical protein